VFNRESFSIALQSKIREANLRIEP